MKFLAVFLFVFVSDAIWTFYIANTARGNAFLAAIFSALTVLLGMTATIIIVADPGYIVPAVLGAFAGTYLTVVLWRRYEKM